MVAGHGRGLEHPVGPHPVTPDELTGAVRPKLGTRPLVDGELMQSDTTADLLFDPVARVTKR